MIGNRMKSLREERNWSQAELAEKLEITRMSINNYEAGKRVPDANLVVKMADLFQVSADYLLGRSGFVDQADKEASNKLVDELITAVDKTGDSSIRPVLHWITKLLNTSYQMGVHKENIHVLKMDIFALMRLLESFEASKSRIEGTRRSLATKKEPYPSLIGTTSEGLSETIYKTAFEQQNEHHRQFEKLVQQYEMKLEDIL